MHIPYLAHAFGGPSGLTSAIARQRGGSLAAPTAQAARGAAAAGQGAFLLRTRTTQAVHLSSHSTSTPGLVAKRGGGHGSTDGDEEATGAAEEEAQPGTEDT